jgi:hypothetical protein
MCLEYCRDEATFSKSMMGAIEEKFHVGRNLPFAFIDSWAKHPLNLGDQQQQDAFARETDILWNFALSSEEFIFKSIQDVLDENEKLKAEVQYLNENINYILEQLVGINSDIGNLMEKQELTSNTLTEAGKDITSIRIELSHNGEEIGIIEEKLIYHYSQIEAHELRISSNENKLSALDGIIEVANDHQLRIDDLSQTSASHQTLIEELTSTTRNLDLLPLGTIMSYHPKNAETFPVGWLPCDGSNIDKGPLMGLTTPGNLILCNITLRKGSLKICVKIV